MNWEVFHASCTYQSCSYFVDLNRTSDLVTINYAFSCYAFKLTVCSIFCAQNHVGSHPQEGHCQQIKRPWWIIFCFCPVFLMALNMCVGGGEVIMKTFFTLYLPNTVSAAYFVAKQNIYWQISDFPSCFVLYQFMHVEIQLFYWFYFWKPKFIFVWFYFCFIHLWVFLEAGWVIFPW